MLGTCNYDPNLKSAYETHNLTDGVNKCGSGNDATPNPFELSLTAEESENLKNEKSLNQNNFSCAKTDFQAFREYALERYKGLNK